MTQNQAMSPSMAAMLYEGRPTAAAVVLGAREYPALRGVVRFFAAEAGTLVQVSLQGLPEGEGCNTRLFGLHIHEGGHCTGPTSEPFADAGGHFNPLDCSHPAHAGDLPPVFGCHGMAWAAFLTDRFRVEEILGRAVIVHERPDDFTTQPAGNAGRRIACGVIGQVH